jgi:hypothetical protein
MSRHHTYITRFRCPKCKRAGSAKWEESERVALPHGREPATLKHLSDGFGAGPQNKIICARCAEQVVYGHG